MKVIQINDTTIARITGNSFGDQLISYCKYGSKPFTMPDGRTVTMWGYYEEFSDINLEGEHMDGDQIINRWNVYTSMYTVYYPDTGSLNPVSPVIV